MCWGQLLRCRALRRTPLSPCHTDICLCCWTQDRVLEGGETFIKFLQFYSGCKLLTSRNKARNSSLCISLPLLGSCLLPANAGMTPFANMSCHPLWWMLQKSVTACYYWQLSTRPWYPSLCWMEQLRLEEHQCFQCKSTGLANTVGQNIALTPCLAQLMTMLCHQFATLLSNQILLARKNLDGLERTPLALLMLESKAGWNDFSWVSTRL